MLHICVDVCAFYIICHCVLVLIIFQLLHSFKSRNLRASVHNKQLNTDIKQTPKIIAQRSSAEIQQQSANVYYGGWDKLQKIRQERRQKRLANLNQDAKNATGYHMEKRMKAQLKSLELATFVEPDSAHNM